MQCSVHSAIKGDWLMNKLLTSSSGHTYQLWVTLGVNFLEDGYLQMLLLSSAISFNLLAVSLPNRNSSAGLV